MWAATCGMLVLLGMPNEQNQSEDMTMNTTTRLLSTLAITFASNCVFAQQCENGVCRISPGFGTQAPTSSFNNAFRSRSSYQTRFQRPATLPYMTRGNATACANCDCNGNVCNCAPGCPTNCERANSARPETRQRRDTMPSEFLAPSRSSTFRAPEPRTDYVRPAAYRSTVSWETDFHRAADVSRQTGRPMLIRIGADWCGHCQRMKREAYSDRQVIADLNRAYVAVDLDADANQDLIRRFQVTSLPTTLVMSPDMRIIDRQEGYRSAEQLSRTISRFVQRAQLDRSVRVACR